MTKIAESVAMEIVTKSLPNPNRPRVRPESEERLVYTDRRSAQCYAEMEMMTAQFNEIARTIAAEPPIEPGMDFADTSTVHHIDTMRGTISIPDIPVPQDPESGKSG